MLSDHFLHPDHVIPSVEFVSTVMKFSDHVISQMSVKFHTVFSQILILRFRIGNTGVQIQYSLQLQYLLQCMVQFSAATSRVSMFSAAL